MTFLVISLVVLAFIVGNIMWLRPSPQPLAKSLIGKWRWHAGLGNWQPVNNSEAWLTEIPWPTPAPAGWLGIEVLSNATIVYWRESTRADAIDTMRRVLAAAGA